MHLIQEEDSPSSKQQTHEMGLLQVRKKWCYGCKSTATKIIVRGPPDVTRSRKEYFARQSSTKTYETTGTHKSYQDSM